jgi:glycosyltransferase involved in cell wall biosynthesis
MIRVLQLCSTSDLGGAERMVLNLSAALPRDQFEMHIGALIGSGALMKKAEELGLPNVHFRFSAALDPGGVWRLIRYCRQHRISIVQCHGLRADSVARWAARLAGTGCVISTLHSIDPWRRGPHVMLDRGTSRFVTRYVAVCEAAQSAAIAREKIDASKAMVVPIGVPAQVIPRERRDEIRRELGVSEDAWPVVGVLANLRDMKGHRHIIQALPAILAEHPDSVFLFAGRDDSAGAIRATAEEAGVAHAIRFLGFVDDTPALFAAMDIFLLPSDWEGFPVSVLEAMQAGVPVIATSVGGIPEMIRDGQDGLLIAPKDPPAIAASVNRLARDFALRATLVKSADARFQSMYTVEAMAEKMAHIYKELVKSP